MDSIAAMEKRYSVRNFSREDFDASFRETVRCWVDALEPLLDFPLLSWQVQEDPGACGQLFSPVPQGDSDALIQYGFQGEQLVLQLVAAGWGTLWQAIGSGQGIPARIRFGKEKGTLHWKNLLSRKGKRKPLSELIVEGQQFLNPGLEQVLVACQGAPSALNRQPWVFRLRDPNGFAIQLSQKWALQQLDLGIVLCHGYLAAKQLFSKVSLEKVQNGHFLVCWEKKKEEKK